MKHLLTNLVAAAMLMLGCSMVSAQGNVTVDRVTHKVLFPSDFFLANEVTTNAYTLKVLADLAAHRASNAADLARQNATNSAFTATNTAQDEAIGSKVSTSEMGDGLTYSNGQWIVTSQGTVTNIDVNGNQASVSNGVAAILIDAEDIGAWSTNTPVELWTNLTGLSTVSNATINGVTGVISNGMIRLSLDLSGYADTGTVAVLSNLVDALILDASLTNLVVVESDHWESLKTNRTGYVYVKTNATVQDASLWSTNPAISGPNISGHTLNNVGGLSLTILTDTNNAAAPSSNNVWTIYAVSVAGTNYLMGVDYLTNRTWIGSAP